ncbi:MAG: hypothetical protein LOD92_04635 [Bacillales bacterium]
MSYTFVDYAWFFLIYAFLGWCTEVAYKAVTSGKFVNRGFLLGPLCPIYGFGMILLLIIFQPIKDNVILLFFGAIIITSALEFITGYILEKVFHHKWWDYSDVPFNIKGYICLKFSLAWGLAAVFVIHIVHPSVEKFVSFMNHPPGHLVLAILFASLIADVIVTVLGIMKIKKRLRLLDNIAKKLKASSDELGINIYKGVSTAIKTTSQVKHKLKVSKTELEAAIEKRKEYLAELRNKYEKLLKEKNFVHKHLERAYPRIKESLAKLERHRRHKK